MQTYIEQICSAAKQSAVGRCLGHGCFCPKFFRGRRKELFKKKGAPIFRKADCVVSVVCKKRRVKNNFVCIRRLRYDQSAVYIQRCTVHIMAGKNGGTALQGNKVRNRIWVADGFCKVKPSAACYFLYIFTCQRLRTAQNACANFQRTFLRINRGKQCNSTTGDRRSHGGTTHQAVFSCSKPYAKAIKRNTLCICTSGNGNL